MSRSPFHRRTEAVARDLDLDALRSERARLLAERERIARAPVERAQAERRIEAAVATAATRFAPAVGRLTAPDDHNPYRMPYAPARAAVVAGVCLDAAEVAFALVARIAPDLMRADLMAALAATYATGDGLTAEDRTRQRTAIDAQLAEIDRDEERALRVGADLEDPRRRWDADPSLVLAAEIDAAELVPDRDRLHLLARHVRRLHALLRDAQQELAEARAALAAAESDRHHAERQQDAPLAMRPDLPAITARAERLGAVATAAAASVAAATAAWEGPRELLAASEEWARMHGLVAEDGTAPGLAHVAAAEDALEAP